MDLLWSDFIDENVCGECENCIDKEYCNYYNENGELDYYYVNEMISEDLNEKFGENEYKYFVMGLNYKNYYGFKQNMNGFSDLYSDVKSLIYDCLHCGGVYENFRIFKEKYNHVIIERCHHDGNEYYMLGRLNNQGIKYYENGWNFDFRKHMIKGVLKDFKFFNY